MSFGDRAYSEADYIPHYVGHPRAPVQALLASAWRGAYFHGQQHGRVILRQPANYNARDYLDEATIQRTVIPTVGEFAGIARGSRTLARGQTHVVARVMYAPRSVNYVRVTHRLSVYSIADDETDMDEFERDISADVTSVGRFQGVNGTLRGFNNRAAAVAGAVDNPFTAGYPMYLDTLDLPLVNVPTTGGVRVRVLVEISAVQLSSLDVFNVPIHVQPLGVLVTTEARR